MSLHLTNLLSVHSASAIFMLLMPLLLLLLCHEVVPKLAVDYAAGNAANDAGNANNDIGGGVGGDGGTFSCYTCNVQAGGGGDQQQEEQQCVERAEECPAASALLPAAPFNGCSTLLHFDAAASRPTELQSDAAAGDVERTARVRKFCTSAGSAELLAPLLSRLAENGGAGGVCQSLDSWAQLSSDPLLPSIAEGTARARLLLRRRGTTNGQRAGRSVPSASPLAARVGAARGNGPPAPPTSHSPQSLLCVCTKSLCNEGDFEHILSRSIYIAGMGDHKAKFVVTEETLTDDENNNKK